MKLEEKATGAPTLQLRLPGTWHVIDIESSGGSAHSIEQFAVATCGAGDEAAPSRVLLRERMKNLTKDAATAGARAMYVGAELAPGVPLSATITVYEPRNLRMTPAIGTDSTTVLDILSQGLTRDGHEATPCNGMDFHALRTITTERDDSWDRPGEDSVGEPTTIATDAVELHRLRADYWCHIPGSKNIVLVSCSTQLTTIEKTMLNLFDAVIGASSFADPSPQAR